MKFYRFCLAVLTLETNIEINSLASSIRGSRTAEFFIRSNLAIKRS